MPPQIKKFQVGLILITIIGLIFIIQDLCIWWNISVCGDVLMVHRWLCPHNLRKRSELKVYKLDWERMEWDEMTSLGDEAIFLAPNHSLSPYAHQLLNLHIIASISHVHIC